MTKLSYLIFGLGDISKGKYYKGILFFLSEVLYILYMVFFGWGYISKFGSLGTVETHTEMDGIFPVTVYGDNSMLILLYSVLTIVITSSCICHLHSKYKRCLQASASCCSRQKANFIKN